MMDLASERLWSTRSELVRARLAASEATRDYFGAPFPTRAHVDAYDAARQRLQRATAALANARHDAGLAGAWIARPALWRA